MRLIVLGIALGLTASGWASVSLTKAQTFPPGVRALVVGVSEYASDSNINLPLAKKDADAAVVTLGNVGAAVTQIVGVVNREDLAKALTAAKSEPRDTFVFYYAGQAARTLDGSASLFLSDATSKIAGNFHADELAEALATIPCRRMIVVMDTCYSASLLYVVANRLDLLFLRGDRNYALFGATRDLAYELIQDGGFYSSRLLAAIREALPAGNPPSLVAERTRVQMLADWPRLGLPWQDPVFLSGGKIDEPMLVPIGSKQNPPIIKIVQPSTRASSATVPAERVLVKVKLDKVVARVIIDGQPAVFHEGHYVATVEVGTTAKDLKVEAFASDGTVVAQSIKVRYDPKLERKTFAMGNRYAVVIGVDEYTAFRPLNNAVNDARAVADQLRTQFGFQVTPLYEQEATHTGILEALRKLPANPPPNSQLVVYFAGHGFVDNGLLQTAFLCPSDTGAPVEGRSDSKMIPLGMLQQILAERGFQQTLLIADSCYSGTMRKIDGDSEDRISPAWRAVTRLEPDWRLVEDLMLTKSFQFIGAGRPEVPDGDGVSNHSPFTRNLLEAFKAPRDVKTYTFLKDHFDQVGLDPRPQFGWFEGMKSTGAEFVFVKEEPRGIR